MFHPLDNSPSKYTGIIPGESGTQDHSDFLSSKEATPKKENASSSNWLRALSTFFRPQKKIALTYQDEAKEIHNSFLSDSNYKKKPLHSSLSSMSAQSTDTNLTSTSSFYSNEDLDQHILFIGEEEDSSSLKKVSSRALDEETIQKTYPTLHQEFCNMGNDPQRLCAFLAKFDTTSPLFINKKESASSVIDFFITQTLKKLGIDSSSNPSTFQLAMRAGKVLTDPRKRKSALVLGGLQQEAFELLEYPPTGELPLKAPALAFVKFISKTDTLDL